MDEEAKPKRHRGFAWLGWSLWLSTVGGLYFVRHESVKRDTQIQQSQQDLLSWMQRADQTMGNLDANKVVAALAQQEKSFTTLKSRIGTDAAQLAESLRLQKDVNGRMIAALGPEGGGAEEALKLADEAKGAGNMELALVYLTNAIRNQPRDLRLLEKYTGWVVEGKNTAIMQGAESLLQGSLYVVTPKDVPAVAKLLGDVARAREAHDKIVAQPEVAETSPADSFEKLEKTPLRWDSEAGDRADAQIEGISALLDQLDELDSDDPLLRKRMTQRLKEVQAFVLSHQILDLAAMRFENLATTEKLVAGQASNENRTAALSALQATESAVNQIWSVPISLVTPDLRDALVALPEKLRKEAEKIQDAVEKPDIDEARTIWEGRRNQEAKYLEWKIIGCKEAIEKCSKLLGKLQGPNARKDAAKLYEEMSAQMNLLKGKQFSTYQKWATGVIEATRKFYDEGGMKDDQKAYGAFYQRDIQKIDQSILSPEVAQFSQAVFSKLLAELDATGQAQLQRDLAFSGATKKKLEDF